MPVSRDIRNEQLTDIMKQTKKWVKQTLLLHELFGDDNPIDMDVLYNEVRSYAQKDNRCAPAWGTFVVVAEQTKHIVKMDKSGMIGTLTIKREEEK